MAKCKNCKHLKYKDDGRERYAWCPFIGDNPDLEFERYCGAFKKMKNADRIRNMTDGEMAEWIHNIVKFIGGDMEPMVNIHDLVKEQDDVIFDSYWDLLEWLQKEVE